MKKAFILLAHCFPAFLLAGCTLVFAEGEPEPAAARRTTTPDAGNQTGDAGAPAGEGGAGTVVPAGGAGGQGGAVSEDPAGGQGGSEVGAGGAGGEVPGLGTECVDEAVCTESAPECPAAAGFCTFFCDEAWVNGWQAVPEKVEKCEELGGACTPIGEERSYCVP